jgi:hypothetical protein
MGQEMLYLLVEINGRGSPRREQIPLRTSLREQAMGMEGGQLVEARKRYSGHVVVSLGVFTGSELAKTKGA